uniref:Uncharacterized protein n=1 Tax=Romanomermis culicivorax TaxID=13658 RepID=A0A915I5W0_ROMCU
MIYIHTSLLNGCMKEKMVNSEAAGLRIMMLNPVLKNGLLKSTTCCLARVIVKEATAMSALCEETRTKEKKNETTGPLTMSLGGVAAPAPASATVFSLTSVLYCPVLYCPALLCLRALMSVLYCPAL